MLKEENIRTPISLAQELITSRKVEHMLKIYADLLCLGLKPEHIAELIRIVDTGSYNEKALTYLARIKPEINSEGQISNKDNFDAIVEILIVLFEAQSDKAKFETIELLMSMGLSLDQIETLYVTMIEIMKSKKQDNTP